MGDSFGWFRWNAGLFGDLDLFVVIDANQRRGWFLDGRSRIGKFRLGRFFMAPILQSLGKPLLCRPWDRVARNTRVWQSRIRWGHDCGKTDPPLAGKASQRLSLDFDGA